MKNNVILENNSIIRVIDNDFENLYIINKEDNSLRKIVDFQKKRNFKKFQKVVDLLKNI